MPVAGTMVFGNVRFAVCSAPKTVYFAGLDPCSETTSRARSVFAAAVEVVTFAVILGAANAAPAWTVVGMSAVSSTVQVPSGVPAKLQAAVKVFVTVAASACGAAMAPMPTSAIPPTRPVVPATPRVRRTPLDAVRRVVVRAMKISSVVMQTSAQVKLLISKPRRQTYVSVTWIATHGYAGMAGGSSSSGGSRHHACTT